MSILLSINGGSSSIKFAVFDAEEPEKSLLRGQIERVGRPGTSISAKGLGGDVEKQPIEAADHDAAADHLIGFLKNRLGDRPVKAIGHRVVHGGLHLVDHVLIDENVLARLREAVVLDSAHLPREITLIESFGRHFPGVPQAACFDTAFHKDLPTVSKMLPIPRRYFDAGVRRFGFHGLSFSYLMRTLARIDPGGANGRVVLAHLGSGASMAAVVGGSPVDTTMSFTPLAGLMMGTRPGDLDPGVLLYLMRTEHKSADDLDQLLNKESGLLGVSTTSSDSRDLYAKSKTDPHAADAVKMFAYHARKYIGALAAVMGGLDTLVFAGGIGEHSADARADICSGLSFLGIRLDAVANASGKDIISSGTVTVRVVATDEESMIAKTTADLVARI